MHHCTQGVLVRIVVIWVKGRRQRRSRKKKKRMRRRRQRKRKTRKKKTGVDGTGGERLCKRVQWSWLSKVAAALVVAAAS